LKVNLDKAARSGDFGTPEKPFMVSRAGEMEGEKVKRERGTRGRSLK